MKCEKCGKEHDGSYGSGRFCSSNCRRAFNLSKASKENRQKHLLKLHNLRRSSYGTWKCSHCDFIGETRVKLQNHLHEKHPQFCKHGAWNKGLTKETNASLKKCSETIKQKLANGEIIPTWTGKKHSEETKQKISNTQSKNVATGKILGHRKDVEFYSCKNLNDEEFLVRGTWELNVAEKLNSQNILWIRDQKIEYQDLNGNKHTYTPDFYLPQTDEYIEVKGLFPESDKQKMDLVKEQHPEKRIYFICKKNYKQFIKGTISLSSDLLY